MKEFSIKNMTVNIPLEKLRGVKRQRIERMEQRVAYAVTQKTINSNDLTKNIVVAQGRDNPLIQKLLQLHLNCQEGKEELSFLQIILIVLRIDHFVKERDGKSYAFWYDIKDYLKSCKKGDYGTINDNLFQQLTYLMEKEWYKFYIERGTVPSIRITDDETDENSSTCVGNTNQHSLPEFEYQASLKIFDCVVNLGSYSSVVEASHVHDMYAICGRTIARMVSRYYFALIRDEIGESNPKWLEERDFECSIDGANKLEAIGSNLKLTSASKFFSSIFPFIKDNLTPDLNFCLKWYQQVYFDDLITKNNHHFHEYIDYLLSNQSPHVELSNAISYILNDDSSEADDIFDNYNSENNGIMTMVNTEIEHQISQRILKIEKLMTFVAEETTKINRLICLERQNVLSLINDYKVAEERHISMYRLLNQRDHPNPWSILASMERNSTIHHLNVHKGYDTSNPCYIDGFDDFENGLIIHSQAFFV